MTLSPQEKKDKSYSFVNSEKFGMATYATLHLFKTNINYALETTKFYWKVIDDIDQYVKAEATKQTRLRYQQHIALDIIIKVQTLIESTLVLVEALSQGYDKVPNLVTNYSSNLLHNITKKISERSYDMKKILAFTDIDSLPLNDKEKQHLEKLYEENIEYAWTVLNNFINFYDKFSIIYNKAKHGLPIQSGGGFSNNTNFKFNQSFMTALDKRKKKNMPKGSFIRSPDTNSTGWFNAKSIVKFNQKFRDELTTIFNDLRDFSLYIVDNHMTYAINCGEVYLPNTMNYSPIDIEMVFFPKRTHAPEELELEKSITDKVFSRMSFAHTVLDIFSGFMGENLVKSFKEDSVTNVWYNSSQ